MKTRSKLIALAAMACLQAAHADWRPDGAFVFGGVAPHDTYSLATGLTWDWDWQAQRWGMQFGAHTELIASAWRADAVGGGSYSLAQVALLPVLRARPGNGRSPWFLEFGIGASYLSKGYATPDKTFSTRWNFYDMLGVGYSFGAGNSQELGLRYVHTSNAGVRDPNPGEDFLQLRYGWRF